MALHTGRILYTTRTTTADGLHGSIRLHLPQPALGRFGNAGRNVVRAAGLNNTDASLFKNFPGVLKRESSGLQLRAEFYNIFNHTQWSGFRTNYGAPDFGAAIAARDARDINWG